MDIKRIINPVSYDGCGIYKITNMENQKCYIGSSINVSRRIEEHNRTMWNLKCSSQDMNVDIANGNYFYAEVIRCITYPILLCELRDIEASYIAKYDSINNGYNTARIAYAKDGIKYDLDHYIEILKKPFFKRTKHDLDFVRSVLNGTLKFVNQDDENLFT